MGVFYGYPFKVHLVYSLIGYIVAHAVIEPSGTTHHTRQHAIDLRFLYQIVGIHSNTMSSHQTGTHWNKIPLACGSLNHVVSVDTHGVENLGYFVHKSDIDVALCVLDNLGSLCHADTWGSMGAANQHRGIECIHSVSYFRSGTRGDFTDFFYRMFFITGIDTFRGIASKKVYIVSQSGGLLHNRNAFFFSNTRVNSRLINHDVTSANHLANSGAGFFEWL